MTGISKTTLSSQPPAMTCKDYQIQSKDSRIAKLLSNDRRWSILSQGPQMARLLSAQFPKEQRARSCNDGVINKLKMDRDLALAAGRQAIVAAKKFEGTSVRLLQVNERLTEIAIHQQRRAVEMEACVRNRDNILKYGSGGAVVGTLLANAFKVPLPFNELIAIIGASTIAGAAYGCSRPT